LRVRIHRGAREVGGNCVEVEAADGSRIALDAGLPLATDVSPGPPSFAGPLDAVLISHPHLDHYGLIGELDPNVPVYIGAEAERLLSAAAFFSPITRSLVSSGHLRDRESFTIGAFTITPYLVDHSGFDSYSMLVEADGRRLFYTGDFRGHGRKARLFDELLADPPPNIDVLITEGTQVGGIDHGGQTEGELEAELVDLCSKTEGLVHVIGSAQNLDRLVTVFRAARRSGRTMVTDLYTATVAAATRSTIPQPGFDGYRVYVPQRQRVLVKDSGEFERIEWIRDIRLFAGELEATPSRFVTYLPGSTATELVRAGVLTSSSQALWSMWDGYLAEPSGQRLLKQLDGASVPIRSLHTSGHATVADLGRLIEALAPTHVVPIHTDASERFADLSDRSAPHPDGTWWAV
jgi:ribonuclease J